MNLGAQIGQAVELEPMPAVPAAIEEMAPVGLTDTDPKTGEVFEVDASDYEGVHA